MATKSKSNKKTKITIISGFTTKERVFKFVHKMKHYYKVLSFRVLQTAGDDWSLTVKYN